MNLTVADEIASAADLVRGKLAGRPVAIVSGLSHLVRDDDGPGAAALVRRETEDLFGYGAADGVAAAARRGVGDERGFPVLHSDAQGAARAIAALLGADDDPPVRVQLEEAGVLSVWLTDVTAGPSAWLAAGRQLERVEALAFSRRFDTSVELEPSQAEADRGAGDRPGEQAAPAAHPRRVAHVRLHPMR